MEKCRTFSEVFSKQLTDEEKSKLENQNKRGYVSEFQQIKLQKEASKNWDKFFMRNENRFFKDRHWTTREFQELLNNAIEDKKIFEVGCGVGNFFYPLIKSGLKFEIIYACDFSPRAINFVKMNQFYDPTIINAFVCDITKDDLNIPLDSLDIVSLIFVLSAIDPKEFKNVLQKLFHVLQPGGFILFRDYGVNDMAMIRFNPGSKLAERFYVRQDGTRAYFFTIEELCTLFSEVGFKIVKSEYITRRTVNKKIGVDAERIFVQFKCQKPQVEC